MPEPRKRHRLRKLVLGEISVVDRPAEEHSQISVVKRDAAAVEARATELAQEALAEAALAKLKAACAEADACLAALTRDRAAAGEAVKAARGLMKAADRTEITARHAGAREAAEAAFRRTGEEIAATARKIETYQRGDGGMDIIEGVLTSEEIELLKRHRAERAAENNVKAEAERAIDRLAKIEQRRTGLSFAQAYREVLKRDPELYTFCDARTEVADPERVCKSLRELGVGR